jgi:hypothetical protein
MASSQSQSTFNQLLVKTAELRISLDLLPSGFCCSHPRIALDALSRIDTFASHGLACSLSY